MVSLNHLYNRLEERALVIQLVSSTTGLRRERDAPTNPFFSAQAEPINTPGLGQERDAPTSQDEMMLHSINDQCQGTNWNP